MLKLQKEVVIELKNVLNSCAGDNDNDIINKTPHIAKLLCQRIDTLAFIECNKEHLEWLDNEMHKNTSTGFQMTSHTSMSYLWMSYTA